MSNSSILDYLNSDAVIVYVGAHPDDEHTVGPLLARAVDLCRKVTVASLTKGGSGWNLHREDLTQTLCQLREKEFKASMKVLGCHPVMFDYTNGLSQAHPDGLAVLEPEAPAVARWRAPGGRDGSTDEILQRWTSEGGDPVQRILTLFKAEKPTVVMVFDPIKGYTNHPEHVVVSQVATEAVKIYNRTAATAATLFYSYSPADDIPGAERIETTTLSKMGGKDYRAIADEAQMCYQSQYGTRGSEQAKKYMFAWHDQQLIQKAAI